MSNDPDGETTQTMTESAGGRPGPARTDGELAESEARAERWRASNALLEADVVRLSRAYDGEVLGRLQDGDRWRAEKAALIAAVTNLLALAPFVPGTYPPAGLHNAIEEARALLARLGAT